MQLLFNDILTIKKELHHFYNILRAPSALDLMSPIYRSRLGGMAGEPDDCVCGVCEGCQRSLVGSAVRAPGPREVKQT